ncbi:MAG: hypothetical protein ABJD11_16355 [Gemmatimonadota bacterium]
MPAIHKLMLVIAISTGFIRSGQAQDRRDDQFYFPGAFNWHFLHDYPEAARLFNAFDYGHAILYERLYSGNGGALDHDFTYLTTDLLVHPPRFAVAEEAVAPTYTRMAWRAKQMFDWAHLLHRQIYDVYADDDIAPLAKDSLIERLTDYYLTRREYAFAPSPKSMELMDGQPFSKVFRHAYPRFNGLIWAYHWLQVGLYDALITGGTHAEKVAAVHETVGRFWLMLRQPPGKFPSMMPMTVAIAPEFSRRHPRAAAIFDNLHMTHDIISDILAANTIPRDRKRAMIYAQLEIMRDPVRQVVSWDEARAMTEMMGGVSEMGGPATGYPNVRRPSPAMPADSAHPRRPR